MIAVTILYASAILAFLGALMTLGLWLDSREDIKLLRGVGIGNGRLAVTKGRTRRLRNGLLVSAMLAGQAYSLVKLFGPGLLENQPALSPWAYTYLVLLGLSAIVVSWDAWMTRREGRAIDAGIKVKEERLEKLEDEHNDR